MFQRTPNFSLPARNQDLPAEYEAWWKANYPVLRQKAREEMRSGTIYDYSTRTAFERPCRVQVPSRSGLRTKARLTVDERPSGRPVREPG